MAATPSPILLSKLARLAISHPQYQPSILSFLRRHASKLPTEIQLRVELRRLAATTPNKILARRIANVLDDRTARFEEGTSVDVEKWLRDKGLDQAADEWAENTDKYKDKFKS